MRCYYAASFQSYIYLTDHFTDTSASLKLYLEKQKNKTLHLLYSAILTLMAKHPQSINKRTKYVDYTHDFATTSLVTY